jgi:DnaJ-class molecular chaperone
MMEESQGNTLTDLSCSVCRGVGEVLLPFTANGPFTMTGVAVNTSKGMAVKEICSACNGSGKKRPVENSKESEAV